jgi:hypothetical protein
MRFAVGLSTDRVKEGSEFVSHEAIADLESLGLTWLAVGSASERRSQLIDGILRFRHDIIGPARGGDDGC